MSNLELSPDAQEAMRGNFILAGESAPPSTAQELGYIGVPELPTDFLEEAQQYLNPAANLGLEAQLRIAQSLLEIMELTPPTENMSTQQISRLEQHYNELPSNNYRLIIAPLFPSDNNLLHNRQNMLLAVRDAYETSLRVDGESLSVAPGITTRISAYNELLRNPSGVSYETRLGDNTPTCLRYRSEVRPLTRSDYLTHLNEKGLVVAGANDVQWTYNFMDVRAETPRLAPTPFKDIYQDICTITNSPEEEIAVCALHAITDSVSNQVMFNLTNEATYAVDTASGELRDLLDVVGVDWANEGKHLYLYPWPQGNASTSSGVRSSINGLAP